MGIEFEVSEELTGITLAYANKDFIADRIFHRVPVGTSTFSYNQYKKDLNLQLPETLVGDSGIPNSVDFASEKKYATVRGDALIDEIPQSKISDSKLSIEDLQGDSVEMLTNVFLACREKRLADLLSDETVYNGNSKTLTNDEKLTDTSVDLLSMIEDTRLKCWFEPNTIIMSRAVYSYVRRNQSLVSAFHKNLNSHGLLLGEELKDVLQVENVFVGMGVANTKKRGQTPSYANLWGNNIILAYINPKAKLDKDMTFGLTAEMGSRKVFIGFNGIPGTDGVNYVKISEKITDVITCPDCGYLLKNVI